MKKKQRVRAKFREVVFLRDDDECKTCGNPAQDAHHITDRSLLPNGGYVLENGISLCSGCHIKAEEFHITNGQRFISGFHPDDLYALIGSSKEKAEEASLKL